MTTQATKDSNIRAIAETVNTFSPGGNPGWLLSFARRESGYNHMARAKSQADATGAEKAWQRNKSQFVAQGNPWISDIEKAWLTSWGLYQLMTPNQLQRWSWTAHPRVLQNPVVATVIAARLFNRAAQRGAKNLCDVREIWATGNLTGKGGAKYRERCESERNRFALLGLPVDAVDWPLSKWGMGGFGTKDAINQNDLYRVVAQRLGLPGSPEGPMPAEWRAKGVVEEITPAHSGFALGRVAIVAAVAGAGGLIWAARRRG